jgi:Ser/Thr protein kinase RdoA (MazF antagonist)
MTFNELTLEELLPVVEETIGSQLTGYAAQFASYINRVYELRTKNGQKLIIKFYRPNRWSLNAILDEHKYLFDCQEAEIPVVAPLKLKNDSTVGTYKDINFSIFPKKAGRQLEINDFEDWLRLGNLVGRMHAVGAKTNADFRIIIDPKKSTLSDCKYLCDNIIPERFKKQYSALCMQLIDLASARFENIEKIRVHGDLHAGNILDRMDEGLLIIDFDDMAMGPAVQDLWLLLPERVEKARNEIELFIEGYEQFRSFDRQSIKCIEPLRAMRMIYFLAWCSRQVSDYQFKKNFPEWGSDTFWQREIRDLQEQITYCE